MLRFFIADLPASLQTVNLSPSGEEAGVFVLDLPFGLVGLWRCDRKTSKEYFSAFLAVTVPMERNAKSYCANRLVALILCPRTYSALQALLFLFRIDIR